MKHSRIFAMLVALSALVLAALAPHALAYDGIAKKEVFTLPSYTTVSGKTLKNVRVGYESYGTLNAAKDNVVLICHFFTGTSHAAGKYKPEDTAPGYWDPIIGAGKAIDTDKYFVISSDTLLNVNIKDPNVATTGPSTIDPDTGKPYGMWSECPQVIEVLHRDVVTRHDDDAELAAARIEKV